MSACAVPTCRRQATAELQAAPHGVPGVEPPRFTFGFCAEHAPEYQALGYQAVKA